MTEPSTPVDPAGPGDVSPAEVSPDDVGREEALAFIIACQRDPATSTAYLGEEPAGIEAELDGLDQPWLTSWQAVRSGSSIVAACTVEWDLEPAMAWLAERLGWTATEVNFALVTPAAQARIWALPGAGPAPGVQVRRAAPADVVRLEPLHTAEFGAAYATATQLVSAYHTVVAEDPAGALLGYAAGTLQDDGQAYVDFTAVTPAARRQGVGRRLVVELVRTLLAAGSPEQVHLTVRESRSAAHALYLSLGMRQETALRGYRQDRPVS